MADLRLITILPQSVQGVPILPGSTGTPSQGSILAVLPPGTILSGYIVNRDPAGNPILRSNKGDIAFTSSFFLKIGSEVVIRVENNQAGLLAHILSVDGQPPEVAAQQSSFAEEPSIILGQQQAAPRAEQTAAPAATLPSADGAVRLTGTLIATSPPAPGAPAPLPVGTQLSFTVQSVTPPVSNVPEEFLIAALPPEDAPPSQLAPVAPVSYSAYAKAVTPPGLANLIATPPAGTAAPAGAPATPTASVIRPDITPSAPPIIVQPGQTVTAMVIAREPTGEALVQTPAGVVRLPPGTAPNVGSTLTLEIGKIVPPAIQATIPADRPAPLTELARQWESLQQIVQLLGTRVAENNLSFVQSSMPWLSTPSPGTPPSTPPQNMPTGLMLFIAALKGNNFTNWLGEENVQWLQSQGHEALVKKAGAEFTTLAKQFTEPATQQWQTLFFPVAVEGDVHQARLFVKRDKKQAAANWREKKTEDTRFVVELDLSQLGELQMDGFVRRGNERVDFDLIVRSHHPLPEEMQRGILQIYNDTGQITGYKGGLVFQTMRDFPVHPMEEVLAEHLTLSS